VRREEFDIGAVRSDGRKMRARSDADASLPAVWDDEPFSFTRHFHNAPRLGEAADATNIGLRDIDQSHVHQVGEFVTCILPFASSDFHWRCVVQTSIASEIIDLNRRLEKEEI